MRKFLASKGTIHYNIFPKIHWDAIERALSSLTISRYLWTVKFVSGFCGVATKMHSLQYWDSALCPICESKTENTEHVIQCEDDRVRKRYKKCLRSLLRWMDENDTHPTIITLFRLTLQHDHRATFNANIPTSMEGSQIHLAALQQDQIGWHNLFCGRISKLWSHVQQQHFMSIDSQRSGLTWATQLVVNLLRFSHSMWKHRCSLNNYVLLEQKIPNQKGTLQ